MVSLAGYKLYDKNIANDAVSHDMPRLMRQAAVVETVLWMRANHTDYGPEYRQRCRAVRAKAMERFWRRKAAMI